MITLGIESTAHTLGIGIFDGKKVLANIYDTYRQPYGGMRPSDAADHHALKFKELLTAAVEKASIKLHDLGLITYSKGPGLAPTLRVGAAGAKYLSKILSIPIIPVHHSVAHIEIAKFYSGIKDPLVVYVSGGNTQLLVQENNRYKVLGETLDIGLGNAIDMFARSLNLKDAHGGTIEQLAKSGRYIELPYTVKGMDFSFTGLVTKVQQLIKTGNYSPEDLAFSFQEHAFSMITEAAERALMLVKKEGIVLCGGVAQNQRFQNMLKKMAEENNVSFGVAPNEFNRDNGGMIAYTGHYLFNKYNADYPDKVIDILPKFRIENAPV